MSSVTEIVESLESITQRMWNVNLDNDAFDALKRKISCLSAQTVVHHALQETATQLRGSQNAATLPHVQGRLGKFIDSLYGNSDKVDATKQRWQKLQELDCETFLFVGVSYTPLDISKMHRTEFSYLMENAAQYVQAKDLPPRWMFRKEIQVTLAAKAHLESIAQFRRKYHELEFSSDDSKDRRPAKRLRLDDASQKNDEAASEPSLLSTQHGNIDASAEFLPEALPIVDGQGLPLPSQGQRNEGYRDPTLVTQITTASADLMDGLASLPNLPLTTAGAEVILEFLKDGAGRELTITLPNPYSQQPFMIIPLQLCANIMRTFTS